MASLSADFVSDIERLVNLSISFSETAKATMNSLDSDDSSSDRGVIATLFEHELCIRVANQYLHCRRKYGDQFLEFVYANMIPKWRQFADQCHNNPTVLSQTMSMHMILMRLKLSGQCPELGEIESYVSQKMQRAIEHLLP
jgi:hypothetical protein